MKRILMIVLAVSATSHASEPPYGMTLSASSTDPYVNTAGPAELFELFLWFPCCDLPDYPDGRPRTPALTAASFGVEESGLEILAILTTINELVIWQRPDVLMAFQGCSCRPGPVARFLVSGGSGSIAFAPLSNGGAIMGTDCDFQAWGVDWIGFSSESDVAPRGGAACQKPVSLETTPWGGIKSLYR